MSCVWVKCLGVEMVVTVETLELIRAHGYLAEELPISLIEVHPLAADDCYPVIAMSTPPSAPPWQNHQPWLKRKKGRK